MGNVKLKPSKFLVYSFYVIIALVFSVVAFIFQNIRIDDKILSSLTYVETESSDYKVYLKENPFYDEEFLISNEKDRNITYVTSYVDYIRFNYNYMLNYTNHVDGNYNYYLDGEIIVYDPNNNDNIYWNKTYNLSKNVTNKFVDSGSYNLDFDYNLDFQQYLNEYNDFKRKDPSVISDAKFIIKLHIDNKSKYSDMDNINFASEITYEIPLSESTFKISKNMNLANDSKTLTKVLSNKNKRMYVKMISISGWVGCVLVILKLILKYYSDYKSKGLYERTLNKILNTYDSILVSAYSMQSIDDLSIVYVNSFEELVDAQAEVRLPINYKENKERQTTTFILVRNNMAWAYVLRESDLNE